MKMVEAPIFHVNGDDPETAVMAIEIALDYAPSSRRTWSWTWCASASSATTSRTSRCHPAADVQIIIQHPGARKLYADKLLAQG